LVASQLLLGAAGLRGPVFFAPYFFEYMLSLYFRPVGLAGGLLLAALGPALAQAPTLTTLSPAANARAVSRSAAVVATFSQPLTAASAGALRVYSSQRGGQLARGAKPAVVSGNTLTFTPTASPFLPGETVTAIVRKTAAGAGGALARAQVQQFTTAAGGPGRGAFGGGSSVPIAPEAYSMALADVDNDGDLDALALHYGLYSSPTPNSVSVHLNGGDASGSNTGVFSNGSSVGVGKQPRRMAVGDIDGDGDLDLVTANFNANTVSVRLNNGAGVFSGSQEVAVRENPLMVALGDVDADGDLDILTANDDGLNTVSIALNGGSSTGSNTGLFPSPYYLFASGRLNGLALADVDNDGDLDLLLLSYAGKSVDIYLNSNGYPGSFNASSSVALTSSAEFLAMGDVDGDGDLDMLVPNNAGNTVNLRLNNGAGKFTAAPDIAVDPNPFKAALADVDADGDLDLVTTNQGSQWAFSVRLNGGDATGSNTGVFSGGQRVGLSYRPFDTAVGDMDGDGDLDLVATNAYVDYANPAYLSVRLNGGSGPLAAATAAAPAALTVAPNPAAGRVVLTLPPAATAAELLDALGRPVRRVPALAGTATLDVTGLAPGLYLVRAAGQVARLVVE